MPSDITVWRYQIRNALRRTQAGSLSLTFGSALAALALLAILSFWVGRNIAPSSGHLVFGGVALLLYVWLYLTSFLKLGQRAFEESVPISPSTVIWHQILRLQIIAMLLATVTVFAFYVGKLNLALFSNGQILVLWLVSVLATLSLANLGIIAAILVRLIAKNSLTRALLAIALATVFYRVIPAGDYPLAAVIDVTLTGAVVDELITLLLASVGLMGVAMAFVELVINRLFEQTAVNKRFQYWDSLTYHRNLGGAYNLGEASLVVELLRLVRDTRTHWQLALIIISTGTSLLLIELLPIDATAAKLLIIATGTSLAGATIGSRSGEAILTRSAFFTAASRREIWLFSMTAGLLVSAVVAIVISLLFFESGVLPPSVLLILIILLFYGFSFQLSLTSITHGLRIYAILVTSILIALIGLTFVREIGWMETYGVLLLWGTAMLLGASYLVRRRPRGDQPRPL